MSSGGKLIETIAASASPHSSSVLPPDTLRFELEYNVTPDLERERNALLNLLGSDRFELFPLHDEIDKILILQFPGIRRTVSRRGLFAMASELAVALRLRSCVPEGASNYPTEREGRGDRSEGAIGDAVLDRTCWVKPDPQLPRLWVLDSLNIRDAWKKTRGAGVIVAQPDTGVALHTAIDDAVNLELAFDAFTGKRGQARDPLDPDMANPGHGTATSSVIACRDSNIVAGVAPEAMLVPIRCLNSVIFTLDGSLIARAILHAREINADVISLSLGGPFISRSVSRALALVVESGIIVVAAGGNCCGFVVYPASDPNAVAVAGVDHKGRPWKGTSRGSEIDIAAPSENVFAARRAPGDDGKGRIDPSQGTSFGTALTAGVAALWVAHHGRSALRKRASALGISVNDLFSAAVSQSARRPDGWDPNLGAGMVDAANLLALDLDQIAHPQRRLADKSTPIGRHATIAELALRGETIDNFDWARHGGEAIFLSTECLARTEPGLPRLTESAMRPEPSTAIAHAALPDILRDVLDKLAATPAVSMPSPAAARVVKSTAYMPMIQGGLESLAAREERITSVKTTLERIAGGAGLEGLQSRSESIIHALNVTRDDASTAQKRAEVLEWGLEGYRQVLVGEDPMQLPFEMRFGLESLVRLTDRPVLKIIDDGISEADPLFAEGGWGHLLIDQPVLPRVAKAVGRINLNGSHIGTGFVVADDVIMTNRHVLEAIGEEVATTAGRRWIFPYGTPYIDFSERGIDGPMYEITGVQFAGSNGTHGRVDFNNLDLACLRVKASSGFPQALETLTPASHVTLQPDTRIFVMGYPAAPGANAFIDPRTGQPSRDIGRRLANLFGVDYGRKYLSPGVIAIQAGGLAREDPRKWVMVHDATTLGGNSGSLVVAIQGQGEVVGLHFAGMPLTGNFAHDLTRVELSTAGGA